MEEEKISKSVRCQSSNQAFVARLQLDANLTGSQNKPKVYASRLLCEQKLVVLSGEFDYDINLLNVEERTNDKEEAEILLRILENKQNPNYSYTEKHK